MIDNIQSKILWRLQEQCLKLLDKDAPRGNAKKPSENMSSDLIFPVYDINEITVSNSFPSATNNNLIIFSQDTEIKTIQYKKGDIFQYSSGDWQNRGNISNIHTIGPCLVGSSIGTIVGVSTLNELNNINFNNASINSFVIIRSDIDGNNPYKKGDILQKIDGYTIWQNQGNIIGNTDNANANEWEYWYHPESYSQKSAIRSVNPPTTTEISGLGSRIIRHVRVGSIDYMSLIGDREDLLNRPLFSQSNPQYLPAIIIESGSQDLSLENSLRDTSRTELNMKPESFIAIVRLVMLAPKMTDIMNLPRPDQFDISNPVRISHIRQQLEYLLDPGIFKMIVDKKEGYRFPSKVKNADILASYNLEGVKSPLEINDFRFEVKYDRQIQKDNLPLDSISDMINIGDINTITSLPSDPENRDMAIFESDVTSGLNNYFDDDGIMVTSAKKGDVAQYIESNMRWIRRGNLGNLL